jgi:hypothetical protein
VPSGDPDDFCPVCDKEMTPEHKCSREDLRRLEAAERAAANRRHRHRERDDVDRLVEGLSMLENDPWGDDGYDPEVR